MSHIQSPHPPSGRRLRVPPLKHTRIEGKEGVKRVRAGLHRVPARRVSNDRQHLAIVPLDDGVAEDQLVLTADRAETRRRVNLAAKSARRCLSV